MAAQKKSYYPWESWNKAIHDKGMFFLMVCFNRTTPNCVNRAIVSAPSLSHMVFGGVQHTIVNRVDVHYRANGLAYDKRGGRLQSFDLSLANYGEAE